MPARHPVVKICGKKHFSMLNMSRDKPENKNHNESKSRVNEGQTSYKTISNPESFLQILA